MRDVPLALFAAAYWFVCLWIVARIIWPLWQALFAVLAWLTPVAIGLAGAIIGLLLLLAAITFEDRGYKAPPLIGCALWFTPFTLAFSFSRNRPTPANRTW